MNLTDRLLRLRTYIRAYWFVLRHPKWCSPRLKVSEDHWPDPPKNIEISAIYKELNDWFPKMKWE